MTRDDSFLALLVLVAAAMETACTQPSARSTPRAAPPVVVEVPRDAGAAPIAVEPPDAGPRACTLQTSLDGTWDFVESCGGTETTYTLSVAGCHATLRTTTGSNSDEQALELAPAMMQKTAEVGALFTLPGPSDRPLFRLVREGHALARWELGESASPVALSSSTHAAGSFSPRCTSFASFIERSEVEKQRWTRTTFAGVSLAYPAAVFPRPVRRPQELLLGTDGIWATDMAGHRASFGLRLAVVSATPGAVLSKIIKADWDAQPEGPMIAGRHGLDIQMGVEGVGQHYIAVALRPGRTLSVNIDWVDAFANPDLTMSSTMQLAIADRIVASIVEP